MLQLNSEFLGGGRFVSLQLVVHPNSLLLFMAYYHLIGVFTFTLWSI